MALFHSQTRRHVIMLLTVIQGLLEAYFYIIKKSSEQEKESIIPVRVG